MFRRQSLIVLGPYHRGHNHYLLSVTLLEEKYWQTCYALPENLCYWNVPKSFKWWTIDFAGQENMRKGCHALAASLVTGQDLFSCSIHHQETPTSLIPNPWAGKKRVCCWALGPVYRRGSSGVTSHQTVGPLKHMWVAPAVPGTITIATERREPEQHKNWFQSAQNSGFHEYNVFLVKLVKFSLFKRFALCKHSKER